MEENTYHYASYIFVQLQQLRSCVTQFMFLLLNQSISRENFECSFRYSKVVLEDLSTQPANIWDQSAQNKQLHLRVKFLRMKQFEQSKSSYSSNTTNTDHSFWERNGTSFRTRRDPLAPTEIFELQPGNFGWIDRTHVTFLWLLAYLFVCLFVVNCCLEIYINVDCLLDCQPHKKGAK